MSADTSSTGRRPGDQYEYRVLTLSRETTRAEARQLLTEQAEYGHWELARVRLYLGGARRVWLRRKIIRVARTG
ncbi:DUF5703 family protein [Paenibacillus sp. TRM 82003]|uniref:DUF5703 family protein n=1 Tax=Kineococcus sp. TRM81007 TaxID=2925831 RepID=UPI001F575895|nr:DUF5703 family protein [Kineococcus sp. TRM81007]MCI2237685.1 DUF5703 family protein [Kineococcus sp. TRM81007]MCI3921703.1 DUF5703 family protein [Paenibacillus sp. TRM 82003]